MKRSLFAVMLVAAVITSVPVMAQDAAPAAAVAAKGEMLYGSNGSRLGAVYKVDAAGAVQLIFEGRMLTIPAKTLSKTDSKLTTSMSKSDLAAL